MSGLCEDRFRFAGRERVPGQTLLVPRQLEMRRRIEPPRACSCGEPAKPAAEPDQPMRLAGEGQGLPVPLAVVVQVPLVALDHLAGHLVCLRHAPLVTPENQLAHRQAENRDRGGRLVMGLQVEQVPLELCGQALRFRGIAGHRLTEVGARDQFSWTARRKASGVSARRGTCPPAARGKEEKAREGDVCRGAWSGAICFTIRTSRMGSVPALVVSLAAPSCSPSAQGGWGLDRCV